MPTPSPALASLSLPPPPGPSPPNRPSPAPRPAPAQAILEASTQLLLYIVNGSLDHAQASMDADPVTVYSFFVLVFFLVFLANLMLIQSLVGSRLRQVSGWVAGSGVGGVGFKGRGCRVQG